MAKESFIKDLEEGIRFRDLFLVKSLKTNETRAGKPYLVLTVMDKTGELSGPIWDDIEERKKLCIPGEILSLSGVVQSYRNALQLKIDGICRPETKVDYGDFLPTSPYDREEMGRELKKIIRKVTNPYLKELLGSFFGDTGLWQRFQNGPAAKGIHHAYMGGLLEHCLSVSRIASFMAEHYPGVDKSLLITGALLHDIGKLEELELLNGLVEYTSRGRLQGHLVIGSEMVADAAKKIKNFPQELLLQVQHLILSHHGRQEFGSPTVPMTVEALLLSYLDDLDAKMNVTEQLRAKIDNDEMIWTDYQRSMERFLFLNKMGNDVIPKNEDELSGSKQQSLF